MKTKVLKYKFDGNTVVAPLWSWERMQKMSISLSDKNEYGNENYDYFHVVCKVENVYFSCGQYSREMLGREEQKKNLSSIAKLDREHASGCGKREPCLPLSIRVLKNSDLTRFLCCKPVKCTKRSRNKEGRNRKRKKRKNAGRRKRSGNRNLTRRNKSF